MSEVGRSVSANQNDNATVPTRRCVILGAGFSAAVSSTMPLTSALGQTVMAHLAADSRAVGLLTEREQAAIARGEVPLANLEVWLSSLASAQPHHDRADHLRRSALFEVVAGHISREIARCENKTSRVRARNGLRRSLWRCTTTRLRSSRSTATL
jgi:hypothetical protein